MVYGTTDLQEFRVIASTLQNDAKIRFRCVASANDDAIYINDVGIYVRGSSVTGISDKFRLEDEIWVYPNPVNSTLFIKKDNHISWYYTIINTVGQVILRDKLDGNSVDVSFLQKGGYYIQFKAQNGSIITRKFIKQ